MKWTRKTMVVFLVLAMCLVVGGVGCDTAQQTTAGTPAQVVAQATQVQQGAAQLAELQAQMAAIAAQLKATGVMDANALAKYQKINAEVAKVVGQVDSIAGALAKAQYTPDAPWYITATEAAQVGNRASAPFNPYSPLIEGVLGIVALGAAAAWRKAVANANAAMAAAADATAKYQAHKQGVELTMKQVSTSTVPEVKAVETQLYENIGEARKAIGV